MLNNPFISIITPTKNTESSIEKTLESVASQSKTLFEHIIIDSNSKDATLDIVKSYKNKYELSFISEEDSGISDAFNKGIKLSKGTWLIFLGSGDELINNQILYEMEKELKLRESELIVWGNILFKNLNGEIEKKIKGNFPKNRLKKFMCIPHQAAFHNKEFFKRYGLFDETYKIAMDYDLCLRGYDSINTHCYINKDISYMLKGGISNTNHRLVFKEMLLAQQRNSIWKIWFIPQLLFFWSNIKYILKKILLYN